MAEARVTLDGPHGMHPVGDPIWNEDHDEVCKRNEDACRACHGATGEGTVLSRMATTRNLACKERNLPGCDENRRITLSGGTPVSCGLCHENRLSTQ